MTFGRHSSQINQIIDQIVEKFSRSCFILHLTTGRRLSSDDGQPVRVCNKELFCPLAELMDSFHLTGFRAQKVVRLILFYDWKVVTMQTEAF